MGKVVSKTEQACAHPAASKTGECVECCAKVIYSVRHGGLVLDMERTTACKSLTQWLAASGLSSASYIVAMIEPDAAGHEAIVHDVKASDMGTDAITTTVAILDLWLARDYKRIERAFKAWERNGCETCGEMTAKGTALAGDRCEDCQVDA